MAADLQHGSCHSKLRRLRSFPCLLLITVHGRRTGFASWWRAILRQGHLAFIHLRGKEQHPQIFMDKGSGDLSTENEEQEEGDNKASKDASFPRQVHQKQEDVGW